MKKYVYYCWVCDLFLFDSKYGVEWHENTFIRIGEL